MSGRFALAQGNPFLYVRSRGVLEDGAGHIL